MFFLIISFNTYNSMDIFIWCSFNSIKNLKLKDLFI